MHIVQVFIHVKPDRVDSFIDATRINASESLKENGVLRFDFMQSQEDKNRFSLVEVYKHAEDVTKHKETPHYQKWKQTVADMMAEPRQSIKYSECFPTQESEWKSPLPR
jgi:quinol monooxygenase YgiN